jgi:hypothetical protein
MLIKDQVLPSSSTLILSSINETHILSHETEEKIAKYDVHVAIFNRINYGVFDPFCAPAPINRYGYPLMVEFILNQYHPPALSNCKPTRCFHGDKSLYESNLLQIDYMRSSTKPFCYFSSETPFCLESAKLLPKDILFEGVVSPKSVKGRIDFRRGTFNTAGLLTLGEFYGAMTLIVRHLETISGRCTSGSRRFRSLNHLLSYKVNLSPSLPLFHNREWIDYVFDRLYHAALATSCPHYKTMVSTLTFPEVLHITDAARLDLKSKLVTY